MHSPASAAWDCSEPPEPRGTLPRVTAAIELTQLSIITMGLVWIPCGIDDCRIGVAYAPLGEVLADMSSAS